VAAAKSKLWFSFKEAVAIVAMLNAAKVPRITFKFLLESINYPLLDKIIADLA
jgi:hypothetical protein